MKILKSHIDPPVAIQNIAILIEENAAKYADQNVFSEKQLNGEYKGIKWKDFYKNILNISANLQKSGFSKGDKMVLFSKNCLKMLQMELAVMSSGGIAVPIFAGFKLAVSELLINHSDAKFLAVEGQSQLDNVPQNLNINKIWSFDTPDHNNFENLYAFDELLIHSDNKTELNLNANPDEICLNMYTSGTMGTPKCVQLSHKNILSQQSAMSKLWDVSSDDRFLSYLPWHHSFGGIFELFSALYNGASIYLESGYGKDPEVIMENWLKVKPTVFFSVPKVYKALVELAHKDADIEEVFFNSGLKFVFTAAAPLPQSISDEFEKRNIRVIEGWGLTETSPCCTITDPSLKREPGVVGMPIPGVSIRIDDEGEIQVKGPNVMCAYYKNDDANKGIFTEDHWYKTGDLGEITPNGLKMITRKDRIFKLLNGEKVIPAKLENLIEKKCRYLSYTLVTGSGREYPVALLFPDKRLIKRPDFHITPFTGCFCPRSMDELSRCIRGCIKEANRELKEKFEKIKTVIIIDDELTIEKGMLTPSMKLAPNNVFEKYKDQIEELYGDEVKLGENMYVVEV